MRQRLLLLLGASAALTFTACPEERAPIDRVQPYAIEKSFFVGDDLMDPADDPEFWTQATLIDVGYGAGQDGLFTSTYAQPMSRIRWQITEDLLIGRLAYERIEGSDGKGVGGSTQNGVVVAAFKIESHFDIQNDYNPTTGEKLNVLVENETDRPWYEREYIRVDWSKNLNTDSYDFDTLSLLGVYGGIDYEPLAYDVTDPQDQDAPQFDIEGGYFDITNKAFATPKTISLAHLGWGIDSFPACFLDNDFMGGTAPSGSCNPVELTIRHSFRRVEDTDYEPVDWDGFRFQAYGGFYVERYGYARNYGMSDSKWHRFLARYDIWERSHKYSDPATMTGPVECFTPDTTPFGQDPNRDDNGDGTADECESVGPGSRCDTFRQRCTLPFAERKAKPIVWYYTIGSDLEYFDATREATNQWDVAMRVAVQTAKYAECVRTGGGDCATKFPVYFGQQSENDDAKALVREVDDCREGRAYADRNRDENACKAVADEVGAARGYSPGVIAIAKMQEMVVLCHSPVEAGDPAACGTPDQRLPADVTAAMCEDAFTVRKHELAETCRDALHVRMGDLRYHQVNVIPTPQTPSPWGIYTDAEDPLTGQAVSASINVWSFVNDLWSQSIVDTARYIKGELTTDEITDGEYVRRWAEASKAATGSSISGGMTREEVNRRVGAAAGVEFEAQKELPEPTPEMKAYAAEIKQELRGVKASLDAASISRATVQARMGQARGTEFEAKLMTPMVQQLQGVQGMPLTDGVMDMVSPLRGGNPSIQRDLYHFKQAALADRGACVMHEAPAPLAVAPLADQLAAKFGDFNPEEGKAAQQARAEKMRQYVARRAHMAVIVHEMGHSIGLRHNFVSSSDAMMYRPQYWQLRTKNGTVTDECTALVADGSSCVGPRYYDPITAEERDNLEWMWMHSSVMDYAGESTQDFLGLGAYDFAAARMFYGDVVSVYADDSYKVGGSRTAGVLSKMDSFGGILGFGWYSAPNVEMHYSQLQKNFQLIRDCKQVDPAKFKPASWNEARDGKWNPTLDGLIVQVDGQYSRCKQQPVDYVPWTSLRRPQSSELNGVFFSGGNAIDPDGRMRVPYGFGTDSWADLGNLSVYRHDNGADPYELFDFFISMQEINHIFDNYRRDRQSFSVKSAAGRTLHRFNEKMRDGAKGLGLLRNIYKYYALEDGSDPNAFWATIGPFFFKDNILAAGQAFDHFARTLARPENGPHYSAAGDNVLRSSTDVFGPGGNTAVTIPNGPTGYYEDVGLGGRPVENALADDKGEYDSSFTVNCGSYYDKLYSSMLLTESVDNFISSSRSDFVDARYRSVSMADLLPDAYRRWLGNNLTGDDALKGPRVATDLTGKPLLDEDGYPSQPLGWISWWGEEPEVCWPAEGTKVCASPELSDVALPSGAPSNSRPVDPQVGWEQQKFLIAWTMLYLPENQQQWWLDQMRVWELGRDADPGFTNRIELHHPDGRIWVAKRSGTEVIFGKRVEKGIAARVLGYANELMAKAYETTPGPDNDGDGNPDWVLPVMNPATGDPVVKWDSSVGAVVDGYIYPNGVEGCDANGNEECTCSNNRACMKLQEYVSVPAYMREAMDAYHIGLPGQKGVW